MDGLMGQGSQDFILHTLHVDHMGCLWRLSGKMKFGIWPAVIFALRVAHAYTLQGAAGGSNMLLPIG